VTEKISAPQGLGIVEEFRLARELTGKRIKATVPGPYTLLVPLKLGGGYKSKETLLADLVTIVNAECRALVGRAAELRLLETTLEAASAGRPSRAARRATSCR
jgi:5-methyltetrahydropteroyltriglutamate--homocysteine methyltransferase